MIVLRGLEIALVTVGVVFFLAGTVGLLRFPDLFSRLHALTKADVLGLGFVCFGLAFGAESLFTVVELALVWVLAAWTSATSAQLVAASAARSGTPGGPPHAGDRS